MTLILTPKSKFLKSLLITFSFLLVVTKLNAQGWITQKSEHGFCGYALDSADLPYYVKEISFLRLTEGDTLIDIGSSSGWFEGAIACLSPIQKQHFVLIDIDSNCLNQKTLNRMTTYYTALKGGPINYTYQIHINNSKNLELTAETGNKYLLRNTLHEIKQPDRFVKQLSKACRENGQVIILEQLPAKKGEKHKGCNNKLMSTATINRLFEKHGFTLMEKELPTFQEVTLQLLRYSKL